MLIALITGFVTNAVPLPFESVHTNSKSYVCVPGAARNTHSTLDVDTSFMSWIDCTTFGSPLRLFPCSLTKVCAVHRQTATPVFTTQFRVPWTSTHSLLVPPIVIVALFAVVRTPSSTFPPAALAR